MGRRREPRHPLGAGEREDRERLRRVKNSKKGAVGKTNEKEKISPTAIAAAGDLRGEGGGWDGAREDSDSETELEMIGNVWIDARAEAGGTGLLLVPLTPADMRTNYPEMYLERCGIDAAHKAGAVAEAIAAEEAARAENEADGEVGTEGHGMIEDKHGDSKDGGEVVGEASSESGDSTAPKAKNRSIRWRRRAPAAGKSPTE